MPRKAVSNFRGSVREPLMGIKGGVLLGGEFWGLYALGTETSMPWG